MSTLARPLALALVLLTALLSACSGDRPAATSAAAPAAAPSGDLLEQVKAAKKVRVGVKSDTPPFGMKAGGTFTGFDVDIATAVVKQLSDDLKTDIDVEFVPVTSADRAKKLLDGDVDMLVASMTITRYRERTLDFTIPYFQDGQGLLVKKDSPVQSYLDLTGKSVGCVKGSTSSYYITQVNPDAKPVRYLDFGKMMDGLANGEVDAVTSDMLILMALQKNAADPAAYRLAGDRFTTEPYGIALRQNQSHFRNALDAALMELWEGHRWQVIRDSWFGPGSRYETTVNFAITPVPR
jgi:polar amino acid transport system substrate-binding protein